MKKLKKEINCKNKVNYSTYSLGSWGWPDIVQTPVPPETDFSPAPLEKIHVFD